MLYVSAKAEESPLSLRNNFPNISKVITDLYKKECASKGETFIPLLIIPQDAYNALKKVFKEADLICLWEDHILHALMHYHDNRNISSNY